MEALSIETRKDSQGNLIQPELTIEYEGWTLRAFEQHGQVKLKGRVSPQFHYLTTAIATRGSGEGDTLERKAITCLGTAPQVLTAMLLQLGASEDTVRIIIQQADNAVKAEAKRQLEERRAAERAQLEEARHRAEEAATRAKPRKESKPRLTEEERAKRQVEIDQRAKEAREAQATERAKSNEQRDAERAASLRSADIERARFASHNQSNPNQHGTWPVKSGPVWSVPEIPDVYSADRIGGGNAYGSIPTVKAITMFGSLYTITVGGRSEVVAWKLVPSLDYPGKAMTYSAHNALPDTHLYRYGYEGILVYFKGQEYVLTQPVTLRKFWDKPAPEWPVVPELVTHQTQAEHHIDQELALARAVREEGSVRSLPSDEANHRQEPRRRPPGRTAA